jgi:hypothetical protein
MLTLFWFVTVQYMMFKLEVIHILRNSLSYGTISTVSKIEA